MQQLFNGSHISRPTINLGGVSSSSSSAGTSEEFIKRARREREEREEGRRRDRSARVVQSFYRGRHTASLHRSSFRIQFDDLLSPTAVSTGDEGTRLTQSARLLVMFYTEGSKEDLKRLARWCRSALGARSGTDKTPWLLWNYGAQSKDNKVWNVLVRQICFILLKQSSSNASLVQVPLFLGIIKMVCDPLSFSKWKIQVGAIGKLPLGYLMERGLFASSRKIILSILSSNRSHDALPYTISLSLLPFKAYPSLAPASSSSSVSLPSSPRSGIFHDFILHILTIPLLFQRISSNSATALLGLTGVPFGEVIQHISSKSLHEGMNVNDALHLLANVVVGLDAERLQKFIAAGSGGSTSQESPSNRLIAYLTGVTSLLYKIPAGVLRSSNTDDGMETEVEGKGKGVEVIVIDDDENDDGDIEVANTAVQLARHKVGNSSGKDSEGDSQMSDSAPLPTSLSLVDIDPRTLSILHSLHSRSHLTAILALSTRYSSNTRPALANFLLSLMTANPQQREEVLNTIMFGSNGERGGGLLREIWRGYLRGGELAKAIMPVGSTASPSTIINSLTQPKFTTEWPLLVLLSELYSRCLLTMGDDEFNSTRNPLSIDEVIGLSSLLRNLAFALYWQEGVLMAARGREQEQEKLLVGTKIGVESLRALVTVLLQQMHARDSRNPFCSEDHWLMTSEFDLQSFIQMVVIEDQKLDSETEDTEQEEEDARRNPNRPVRPPVVKLSLSKRQMAFVSPRLGVLNNIPFVIPFKTRVAIFRQFVANDRTREGLDRDYFRRVAHFKIRRDHISEDAYVQLNALGPKIKGRVPITFIDQFGMEEEGIDGGGLFKELLTGLSKEAFDTDRGLWLATAEQELYPSPSSYSRESTQLAWYSFLGRILGKALYDGILVDVRFAGFFLSKWLGRQSYLDDLVSLDPELYNGLLFLKNMTGDVESELMLNFDVTEDDFGAPRSVELIPGGSDIPVTNENRVQYIYLMSHYHLNKKIAPQCAAFFKGLSEVIPERFLRMFNQAELRMLVGGADRPIDVDDLRANTVYGEWPGDETNETIRDFWSVVEGFNREERSKLVKFVTSCARPPLLGFKELFPRFAIRKAGSDETRLPTSSTCVNLLKLPPYKDRETLKSKLLYAINSGAGFGLA